MRQIEVVGDLLTAVALDVDEEGGVGRRRWVVAEERRAPGAQGPAEGAEQHRVDARAERGGGLGEHGGRPVGGQDAGDGGAAAHHVPCRVERGGAQHVVGVPGGAGPQGEFGGPPGGLLLEEGTPPGVGDAGRLVEGGAGGEGAQVVQQHAPGDPVHDEVVDDEEEVAGPGVPRVEPDGFEHVPVPGVQAPRRRFHRTGHGGLAPIGAEVSGVDAPDALTAPYGPAGQDFEAPLRCAPEADAQ